MGSSRADLRGLGWLVLAFGCCAGTDTALSGSQDFSDWQEEQQQEFHDFSEERDKRFHKFLKKEWEAFRVFQGEAEDAAPKPDVMPTAPEDPKDPDTETVPEPEVVRVPPIDPQTAPTEPGAEDTGERADGGTGAPDTGKDEQDPAAGDGDGTKAEAGPGDDREAQDGASQEQPRLDSPGAKSVVFEFLGHELEIATPGEWGALTVKQPNRKGIADFWARFANTETEPVVDRLDKIRGSYDLNGWGYLQLVDELARRITNKRNTRIALTWAVLLKSGVDVRVGYRGDELHLLYTSAQKLYDTGYFTLGGQRYYVFEPEQTVDRLTSYEGEYDGASRALDVAPRTMPEVSGPVVEKTLSFRFQGKSYELEVPIKKKLTSYLDTIPQMDVVRYFQAEPGPRMRKHIIEPLEQAVEGKSRNEQLNLLLRFVQTAFEYKTDQKQFGHENYMFPEETAFYPASDCEDRGALFAWLVREILDLRVAVLDYPGHIATAVEGDARGGYSRISVEGEELVVADPTYINANVGMVMPKFKNKRPNALPLWRRR